MKKIGLIVAAICMMAVTTVQAQEFNWGVKAGLNVASIGGDFEDGGARIGYVAGLTGEFKFCETTALSVDLLYSSEGAKEDGDGLDLGYLNIPILFNYYLFDGFAVKAGIQPGFLLTAKYRSDGESESVKDWYNGFAFAIPVGVSYDLSESLVLDARYNIGASNIFDGGGDYKERSNVFQLSVGYKF